MTDDEWTTIRTYVRSGWPAAAAWPDATWDQWVIELDAFTYDIITYVLAHWPAEDRWPPSWRDVRSKAMAIGARIARQRLLREGSPQW